MRITNAREGYWNSLKLKKPVFFFEVLATLKTNKSLASR
jgi:hypothetical protein